jgi:hypothetical protein
MSCQWLPVAKPIEQIRASATQFARTVKWKSASISSELVKKPLSHHQREAIFAQLTVPNESDVLDGTRHRSLHYSQGTELNLL